MKILKIKLNSWKFFGFLWLLSIFTFTISFVIATNFFRSMIQGTDFGNSQVFPWLFFGSILVGCISFGMAILSFLYEKVKNKKRLTLVLCLLVLSFGLVTFLGFKRLNDQTGGQISSVFEGPKLTATVQEIIDLTNKERLNAGLKPVKEDSKLDEAAQIRAQKIIDFNEWNHEATKSGVPYTKAIKEVNYWNITYGENLATSFRFLFPLRNSCQDTSKFSIETISS